MVQLELQFFRSLVALKSRIATIGLCVLSLLLVSQGKLEAQEKPEAVSDTVINQPTGIPDRIILNLTETPATSIAINWRTSVGAHPGIVEIKLAEDAPEFVEGVREVRAHTEMLTSDLSSAHYHSAIVDRLTPNTQYIYRVGDGTNWSEWSMFRTADDKASGFSFIYFGDSQNEIKSKWSRIVREAFRTRPQAHFMLHAGDLINSSNRDAEWGDWFYAGGWINRSMPSMATPGNHEYVTRKIDEDTAVRELTSHWRPTFTFPKNGPNGLDETCYYIDYQDCRLISLNSNESLSKQAEWLDQILEEGNQRWGIVTMHHPVYSAAADRDNPQVRNAFQPIFDKHKVDLVLQGHDHTYARSRLMQYMENEPSGRTAQDGGGTLYVVSVSGPKMYAAQERDFIVRTAEDTQLFQIIQVEPNRIRYEARTATGKIYDAFDLEKVDGEPNRLIDRVPDSPERRRPKSDDAGN